jgi:hypothetical protein
VGLIEVCTGIRIPTLIKKYIRMNPVGDEVGENLLKITIFSWIL